MRLTDKVHRLILPELHNFIESKNQSIYINQKTTEALDKLGQLEDIEDELGIDLVTLFKAIKYGIYVKDRMKPFKFVRLEWLENLEPMLIFDIKDDCESEVYVKGYRQTWALTEEELKK